MFKWDTWIEDSYGMLKMSIVHNDITPMDVILIFKLVV